MNGVSSPLEIVNIIIMNAIISFSLFSSLLHYQTPKKHVTRTINQNHHQVTMKRTRMTFRLVTTVTSCLQRSTRPTPPKSWYSASNQTRKLRKIYQWRTNQLIYLLDQLMPKMAPKLRTPKKVRVVFLSGILIKMRTVIFGEMWFLEFSFRNILLKFCQKN